MAISLPSSSSSSRPTPIWSYDVFLSFRGEDTRNIFTAHLYPALCQRGIKTYIDDKDLERGEIISTTLFKAIEESMISIIVLSPNYASSTWCLEELIKILECKKIKQQIVLPVFYHVDPSDLRNQRGSFGQVLARHQESFKDDSKVQRWKEALQEVAELAGEHLKDGNEYEFMQKIIRWVDLTIVKSTYKIHIAEYLIGLESRLKDLNIDLGIGKDDITLMIGIYGIGGIGKTTTAKAVFNSIGHKFEARCFLENVREVSSQGINGLNQLQEKLLNELLGNSISHNIGGVGATNIIKHRLCSKMVLIILDDVSESRQLEELAGNHNWFGPGSRIVITTRDQHLLKYHRVDSMYEVQGLVDSQAIQLFCWHAFKRDKPIESYANLTKCIIGYAKGLPLALRVLGSYLWGRSIQQWKSALEKYEESPHMDIYKILKISYDGLDDKEKDIFLDIACFFKGGSLEYVKKMLDSCGFESTIGIARLSEKCLINVSHRYVEMHDLLQEMGKEIVRQKSPKEAGERSRLWFHEDVRHVLEENTGTNKIEGILLDFPEDHDKIRLHSEAFNKMRILRLFINRNAQFSTNEKPNYLSNELRVLDWPQYPSSFLPSNFRGNNLVEFQMPNSIIKELGGLKSKNLIDMDLYGCHLITKIPDLSSSPNLEKLNVGWCVNLVEVHHSIGFLDKLQSFDVGGCYKLKIFPKRFKLRSLSYFGISQCSNLEDFPEIECEMEFLHELDLCGTSIKELPSSIDNLKGLENLYLEGTSLRKLPSSSGILSQLKVVTLKCCCLSETNFFTIGNYFPVLERLDLSGSDIVIFPPQGVRFDRLRYLTLNRCDKLEKILPLPLSLDRVEARRCKSLASFALLSEITYGNNYIEWIDLYGCHKLFANKNMRPIPSQKESHSKEQHWAYQLKVRDIDIIFPGKRTPSWFDYRIDVYSDDVSIEHEMDINPPRHWSDIDGIVFYIAFGDDATSNEIYINVSIHDGSDWKDLYDKQIMCSTSPCSGHVWMHWMSYDRKVDVSRLRFRCSDYINEHLVLGSVGIHFLKKHEKRPSSIWESENDGETSSICELKNDYKYPIRLESHLRDLNIGIHFLKKHEKRPSSICGLEKDDETSSIWELKNDYKYPIGLESRVKDLNTDLEIGRNDITLMIGIYGTGGIGKTTIAKAVFNSIGHQFEARCFLENVRENSWRDVDLVKLRNELLRELLGKSRSFNIGIVKGINVIKHRLRSKRVLIILDDVNKSRQLNKLAGNKNWFGLGSRIVITTRDRHLLTYHQVDSMYEVQELDENQATQLFSWHAFKSNKPAESYVKLTQSIIGYAKGLPLALILIGSDLHGKNIEEWKSALEKYKRTPPKDIYEILKISYDGLDDDEKIIFLDIACFFKGESVEYVTKMLDVSRFSSSFSIRRLKDKCLINISTRYYCQYVEMHDLLQEMGKEIVRQDSPKEAGERSRLWFHEDIRHVLEANTGTNKIEAIWLDFPYGHDKIRLHPKAFKKMKNLRLFINQNAQFSEGPNYLSNELRVFDWPKFPSSFLPSNFRGNNLVEFKMFYSCMKELGDLKSKNLTYMVLSGCEFITKIPDLSSCPNLEMLDLSYCGNLVEIHDSVGLLDKLRILDVSDCSKLRILPKRFKLRSLSYFHIYRCSNLEDFPEIECEMELLHELDLWGTSIKELPSSIDNLKGLESLNLSKSRLEKLPSSSGILTRLRELCLEVDDYDWLTCYLKNSSIFHEAGNRLWKAIKVVTLQCCCLSESNFFTNNYFPALETLDLSGSDIVIFPPQGVTFDVLQHLHLNKCDKLEEILALPLSLERVEAHKCWSLERFALLSEIPYGNNNIKWIDLNGCYKLFANKNMRPIPPQEESHSKEQHWTNQLKVRNIDIIFPRKRIPSWFDYCMEVYMSVDDESIEFEIDINPPQHWNDIDGIVFYAAFGHNISPYGINAIRFSVTIHDGSDWKHLYTIKRHISFFDDHVWMWWMSYDRQVDISRLRFRCHRSGWPHEYVNLASVGIHFLKKHEKRPFSIWELEKDDENPNQDLELENADENPKEVFGKRRRDDEYGCNMEPNLYRQQKRQHSSTMGITITELENDDENPKSSKEDLDLELKLG